MLDDLKANEPAENGRTGGIRILNGKILLLWTVAGACAFAQYSGPSVLSRNSSTADNRESMPAGFRFLGGVNAIYDSGLTPVSVDGKGDLLNVGNLFGVEANLGMTGIKRWAHATVSLGYVGNYRHYTTNSTFDGSDHILSVEGQIALTKRLSLISRNGVGTVARAFSSYGSFIQTPDVQLGIPQNTIFDNRSYFLQTTVDVLYQKSTRLSFVAGGDGFFTRRQSKALVGSDGYGAHASVAYRWSRRDTVDVAYTFLHFDYPRAFGETDLHQVTAGYQRAINKNWQAGAFAGVYRADTVGIVVVQLDPATAALFGQGTSQQAFQAVRYLPSLKANLSGRFHKHGAGLSYDRQPSQGNGVYLTSNTEAVAGSWNYTGLHRLSFGVSAGYQRLKGLGQTQLGTYSSGTAGGDVNYNITQDIHFAARYDFRRLQIDTLNGLNRPANRVSIGIAYSPGERPIQFFR